MNSKVPLQFVCPHCNSDTLLKYFPEYTGSEINDIVYHEDLDVYFYSLGDLSTITIPIKDLSPIYVCKSCRKQWGSLKEMYDNNCFLNLSANGE